MSIIIAIILGIVQGLTEFLPVSSSGHLVLLQTIFGIQENQILFDIILHLGTLVAVVFIFKKQVLEIIKNPLSKKTKMLVLATIITLSIAILFKDFFEDAFNGGYLAFSFLITASFLILAEFISKKYNSNKALNFKNTAVMGVFQGLAILPGVSRSGSTISSAIVQGVNKKDAAEISFLMSIPIILASLVWELLKVSEQTVNLQILPTIIGFLMAIIFGIIAIKIMLKIIEKAKYWVFSVYLIALAIFLMFNEWVFMWF